MYHKNLLKKLPNVKLKNPFPPTKPSPSADKTSLL